MPCVHSSPLAKKHSAPVVSPAFAFYVLSWAASIALPFFLGYATHNFWAKDGTYLETPKVLFSHEMLLMVEGSDAGTDLHWSTEPQINSLFGQKLRVAQVSSSATDSNRDGSPEAIKVMVSMPIKAGETVNHARLMLQTHYSLSSRVALDMKSLVSVDVASPVAGGSLWVDGALQLRQANPLQDRRPRAVYKASALPVAGRAVKSDLKFSSIWANYMARNETTHLVDTHSEWTAGGTGGATTFDITVNVRIPPAVVVYRPGFWEVIKVAWVQYLALLLLVRYFMQKIEEFVFGESIFATTVEHPAKAKAF